MKKHPEILMFQLGKKSWETSKLTSTGLTEILSLPSLSSLIIGGSIEFIAGINVKIISKQLHTLQLIITGEILINYKGTLPCLENLNMSYCRYLTDKGLRQILQLCGSTLRSLVIHSTNITGENLSEYSDIRISF